MKKAAIMGGLAVLCLGLAGCSAPAQAADGQPWNADWVTVGNVLGVDTPDGLEPRENSDALAANGMYYATWSIGEAEAYTNAEGDDAELYDAQVYLLLAGYDAAEKAQSNVTRWLNMADNQYQVTETTTSTFNGQEFTILTFTYSSEENPYAHGVLACGVYRNYAVNIELSCRADFEGDAQSILGNFLEHCHYAV